MSLEDKIQKALLILEEEKLTLEERVEIVSAIAWAMFPKGETYSLLSEVLQVVSEYGE